MTSVNTCAHGRYEIVTLYCQPRPMGGQHACVAVGLRCVSCFVRRRVSPDEFAAIRHLVTNLPEWRRWLPPVPRHPHAGTAAQTDDGR